MIKIVKYLLWASFLGTFGESMITPIVSLFNEKVGGNVLDAGIGFALFSIFTGIVVVISGKIKWFSNNTHGIVFWGFLFAAIGDFSFYFVHNVLTLYAVQILNGISVGLLNPAWEALYTKSMKDGEEHELWSLWGGGASISTGIAALAGAVIANIFGFKTMFLCTTAINGAACIFAYWVFKSRKDGLQTYK